MKILDYAKSVEPCQRNWNEEYVMPLEEVDYITEVCTTMPTKQNRSVYTLVRITNKNIINKMFEASYSDNDVRGTVDRNTQVKANLLLIWVENKNIAECTPDLYVGVGISSGAAALAAAELGYKTGFCRCFNSPQVKKILKKNNIRVDKESKIVLMLGIGESQQNVDRKMYTTGSRKGTLQRSISKTIPVVDII